MPRPVKPIDPVMVRELAAHGCTVAEIAEIVGVSARTLQRRARRALIAGRAQLCMSLRRKQVEVALGGNVAMLIWLGKQYLGQREPPHGEPEPLKESEDLRIAGISPEALLEELEAWEYRNGNGPANGNGAVG